MDPVGFQVRVCEGKLLDTEVCRWRSKWCRHVGMHLVSLESLRFRNLNVNTTDYCYRQYIPLYSIVDIHMHLLITET